MHRMIGRLSAAPILCIFLFPHMALGQSPDGEGAPVQSPTIEHWAEQLGHPQFATRERASRELFKAGEKAVPVLEKVLKSGDLETTKRLMRILGKIAMEQAPNDEGGAWKVLLNLSETAAGTRGSAARVEVEEIRLARKAEGERRLTRYFAFIGVGKFALGALSMDVKLIRLSGSWKDKEETLNWLRWITDIEYAIIEGDAVDPVVLASLAQMPDLQTVALVDGELSIGSLNALGGMPFLQRLELRYTQLEEGTILALEELPIRISLNLMGTGISEERFQEMQRKLSGLALTRRQGGFLGVQCDQGICRIMKVVVGSAAEKAGLRPGDVIVRIENATVDQFADLKREIDLHSPGEEVLVQFLRNGEQNKTKLKLGKLIDP